jgi:hypothetical protein
MILFFALILSSFALCVASYGNSLQRCASLMRKEAAYLELLVHDANESTKGTNSPGRAYGVYVLPPSEGEFPVGAAEPYQS